jgi:hypothetical protein
MLAGFLLLGVILAAVAVPFSTMVPDWVAGVLAWGALALLLSRISRLQRVQMLLLLVVGGLCASVGWLRGVMPDFHAMLTVNTGLLALLAGVSFLRLVALPVHGGEEKLPSGHGSFLRTLVGTHLFSSVINLSALMIVMERLHRNQPISRQLAAPLSRAFSAAAFWSPFFAAMGVALIYAPGASMPLLVLQGAPLAILALALTFLEFFFGDVERLRNYRGYPMHFSALWIPVMLVAGVLAVRFWRPDVSVLLAVAGSSLLLTVMVRALRDSATAKDALIEHVTSGLPRMSGELALFLSAGVLATGLGSLFISFDGQIPIWEFSFSLASLLLCTIVLLAIAGIHPVISIATSAVWLAPVDPDPNILGTLFLSGWAIGVVVAPLSGMNLALQGRYGIRSQDVIRWNWRYALIMLIAANGVIWMLFQETR